MHQFLKIFILGTLAVFYFIPSAFAQFGGTFGRNPPRPQQQERQVLAPGVYGSQWESLHPEEKIASVIESFWVFARASEGGCDVAMFASQNQKIQCLRQKGFNFRPVVPEACKLRIDETLPRPATGPTTWDGKPAGIYPVARVLEISLNNLDPDLIYAERWSHQYTLYFQLTPVTMQPAGVVLSSAPDQLLKPPPPPMLSDADLKAGVDESRIQNLIQDRANWKQAVFEKVGRLTLPYFDIAMYAPNAETNTEQGRRRILSQRPNLYLVLATPNVQTAINAYNPDKSDLSEPRFVDAVKAVIAKCVKR